MKRYISLIEKLLGEFYNDKFGKITFYINPQKLNNFPKGIRGLLDKKGNLYMWENFDSVLHIDAIGTLYENKILKIPSSMLENLDYGYLDPFIPYCCGVQELYGPERGKIYMSESYRKPHNEFTKYCELAKKINPQFEFINKKVTWV